MIDITLRSVSRMLGLERLAANVIHQHAAGADLSALILPPWLDGVLNHDWIAYPLHTACGSLLHALDSSPRLTALEWLKAAAHAESALSQRLVGAGLRRALQRAEPYNLWHVLNAAMVRPVTVDGRDVRMRRRQLAVVARAGLTAPASRDE